MTGWVRPSLCGGNGECIEARWDGERIWIRWADADGTKLGFTRAEWDAFAAGVKNGDFDHLTERTTQ